MKLSIATIGGVIVVAGILSATRLPVGPGAFYGFSTGTLLLVISTATLAAALAGLRFTGGFTRGPDLRRVGSHVREGRLAESTLLIALVDAHPDWAEDNDRAIDVLQRLIAWSLVTMAAGVLVFIAALFYILGGVIRG